MKQRLIAQISTHFNLFRAVHDAHTGDVTIAEQIKAIERFIRWHERQVGVGRALLRQLQRIEKAATTALLDEARLDEAQIRLTQDATNATPLIPTDAIPPDPPDHDRIFAPWTEKQVDALNVFQAAGVFHPFTCPRTPYGVVLFATQDGWHCPSCDYTQNWAHAYMADPAILHRRPNSPDPAHDDMID